MKRLSCPRCSVPMVQGQTRTGLVHGCVRCGGVWVAPDLVARIRAALDPAAMDLSESIARQGDDAVDLRSAIHCPVCAAPLQRHPVPGTQVEVDTCERHHGTWFDRNELRSLAQAAAVARGVPLPATVAQGSHWGAHAATGGTGGLPLAAGPGAGTLAAAAAGGALLAGAAAYGAYHFAQHPAVPFPPPHARQQGSQAWGDVAADVAEAGVDVADLAADGLEVAADAGEAGLSLLGFLADLF